METYKENLARTLAETGALFFGDGLVLKDGRPSPYFVNLGMFKTGRLALKMGTFFADMLAARGLADRIDVILGPSYKGSAIALATAVALWQDHGRDLLFDYDRKEAKAHGEGSLGQSLFVNNALFDGCRVLMVDDVATSMGTKYEFLEKIEAEAKRRGIAIHWAGIGIAVDREQTAAVYDEKGRAVPGIKGGNAMQDFVTQTGIPVMAVAGIREMVGYLYTARVPVLVRGQRQPIDDDTKAAFDAYLATYGVA